MNKKSKIFLAAVAAITCLAGIASVFLVHYSEEKEKEAAAADSELAAELTVYVRRYELTLPMLRFTQEEPPAFEEVLDYFTYEGFYSAEAYKGAGAQTPDLLEEYATGDNMYSVPAEVVESLIADRFGVAADRDSVAKDNDARKSNAYYDSDSGCYVFDASVTVMHTVSVTEREETEPGVYRLVVCKDTAVSNYPVVPVYREYTVAACDNGFKFLSVADYTSSSSSTEPDDRKFRQIVSCYTTACDSEFDMGDTVPYGEIFDYYKYEGCMDVNEGVLKPELEQYMTDDGVLRVPASVADAFLSKRFRTEIDKESVSCYNSETDTYDFVPLSLDSSHYYTIVDKTKLGSSTYVIYAMEKPYGDSTGFSGSFYRFVVQARRDEFKILSVSLIYDYTADEGLYPVELEKNSNYSIVETASMEFEYVIYAADGSEAERVYTGSTYPRVSSEDGVTSVRYQGATKYYSVDKDIFSDSYYDVYAQSGSTIAYAGVENGKVTIFVTDVFDTSDRTEIPFDREFSPEEIVYPSDCIVSMEFTEDGELTVSYVQGESYTVTEETISLSDTAAE
jgi:hypothetical protein